MTKMKGITYVIVTIIVALSCMVATYAALVLFDVVKRDKINLEVTISDVSYAYDDTAHTCKEFTYEGKLQSGDNLQCIDYIGSVTYVGETDVSGIFKVVDKDGTDVSDSYNIKVNTGKCVITKRPITLKVKDSSIVYTGLPIASSDFEYNVLDLIVGHQISPKFTPVGTDVTDDKGNESKMTVDIVDFYGRNVSSNYDITCNSGTVIITKAPMNITFESISKVYDGEDASNVSFVATNDFDKSLTIEATFNNMSKYVNADTYSNIDKPTIKIKNGETDVTDNFQLAITCPVLEVKKRDITFTGISKVKEYDGVEITVENDKCDETSLNLVEGHKYKLNYKDDSKITNVGSVETTIDDTSIKIMADSKDVTSNYNIKVSSGRLVVNKKVVYVTTKPYSKDYDGKDVYAKDIKYNALEASEADKLVGNVELRELEFRFTKSTHLVNVSDSVDEFENLEVGYIKLVDTTTNSNVSDNYDFKIKEGYTTAITIKKRELTADDIVLSTDALVYTGEEQTPVLSVKNGEGFKLLWDYDAADAPIDKGSYTIDIITNEVNNYSVATGTVKQFSIGERIVNVTWGIYDYSYSGTAIEPSYSLDINPTEFDKSDIALTYYEMVNGIKKNVTFDGSAGSYILELKSTDTDYALANNTFQFMVKKAEKTPTNPITWDYTTPYEFTGLAQQPKSGLSTGDYEYTIRDSLGNIIEKAIDIGSYTIEVSEENYSYGDAGKCNFEITKANIALHFSTDKVMFNGTNLFAGDYIVTDDASELSVSLSNYAKNNIQIRNALTVSAEAANSNIDTNVSLDDIETNFDLKSLFVVYDANNNVTNNSNYDISIDDSDPSLTEIGFKKYESSYKFIGKTYNAYFGDSTYLDDDELEVTLTGSLPAGVTWAVTSDATDFASYDASTTAYEIDYEIDFYMIGSNNQKIDVSGLITFNDDYYVVGKLYVSPRPITLITPSASKNVDGGTWSQTPDTYWLSDEAFATDFANTYNVSFDNTAVTDVGVYSNSVTLAGSSQNYQVSYSFGTLTINSKVATVVGTSLNTSYGSTLSLTSLLSYSSNLSSLEKSAINNNLKLIDDTDTDVTSSYLSGNTISGLPVGEYMLTADEAGLASDLPTCSLTYVSPKITVEPARLYVSVNDITGKYKNLDSVGTALTKGFSATLTSTLGTVKQEIDGNLVEVNSLMTTLNMSISLVGADNIVGEYDIDLDYDATNPNYEVILVNTPKLTITPQTVVIMIDTYTVSGDGINPASAYLIENNVTYTVISSGTLTNAQAKAEIVGLYNISLEDETITSGTTVINADVTYSTNVEVIAISGTFEFI